MNAQQWALLIVPNLAFFTIAGVIGYSFWQEHRDRKDATRGNHSDK